MGMSAPRYYGSKSDLQVQTKASGKHCHSKTAISPEFVLSEWEREVNKETNLIDPSIRSSEAPAPRPAVIRPRIPSPSLIDLAKTYAQSVRAAAPPKPLPITQKQEKFCLPKFLPSKPEAAGSSSQSTGSQSNSAVPIAEGTSHSPSTVKAGANPSGNNSKPQAKLLKKVSIPKGPTNLSSQHKVAAEKKSIHELLELQPTKTKTQQKSNSASGVFEPKRLVSESKTSVPCFKSNYFVPQGATAVTPLNHSGSSVKPKDSKLLEGYKTSGESDLDIHNHLTGTGRPTNPLSHPTTSWEHLEEDQFASYPPRVKALLQTVESQQALFLQNADDPSCQLLGAKLAAKIQMFLDPKVAEEDFLRLFHGWNPLRLCCKQIRHPRMSLWFKRTSHPEDIPPGVLDRIRNMTFPSSPAPTIATDQPMVEEEIPPPPEEVQPPPLPTNETPQLRDKSIEVDLLDQPLPQLAPQPTVTQPQTAAPPPIMAPPPPGVTQFPGAMPPPLILLPTRPTQSNVQAPRTNTAANCRKNNRQARQTYTSRGYQASIHEEMIRIGRTMQGQFQTLDAMRRQNRESGTR
ncbi:hypothetical protein PCANC_24301 [Puccinia coronata f. sp. avenae]|uniref:Uncharacterized protein n=1 Tax=Puccinia coronata f. sp. avenae TaxID=200324 RepID=A0A2N5TU93_9BASI|nr:hypothetical protein PCANC_24301 [Puccinia coronata f. sp. avenae]